MCLSTVPLLIAFPSPVLCYESKTGDRIYFSCPKWDPWTHRALRSWDLRSLVHSVSPASVVCWHLYMLLQHISRYDNLFTVSAWESPQGEDLFSPTPICPQKKKLLTTLPLKGTLLPLVAFTCPLPWEEGNLSDW